jgi:hypothetical protein
MCDSAHITRRACISRSLGTHRGLGLEVCRSIRTSDLPGIESGHCLGEKNKP